MPTPLRVLIAEDSPDDAELILLSLSRGSFDPDWTRVETAEEMRVALGQGHWEIVCSDYSMPGFGAAEALAICRDHDPDLPFVVISGTIGEDRAVEIMRFGASDYFLKDNLTRLAPAIQRELREAEIRRSKQAVEREASMLAALVNSATDAIACADLDGHILYWNSSAEKLFGYSAAEVMGKKDFLVPPNLLADIQAKDIRLSQGEHLPPFETVRLRKGGEAVEVSLSLSPVWKEGQVVAKSASYRDITKQKESERENAMLRSLVQNSPDFIAVTNTEGDVVFLNRGGQALVGLESLEAARKTSIGDYHRPTELHRLEREVIPVLRTGNSVAGEIMFRHFQTQREIPAEWVSFPIAAPDPGVPGLWACIARDITARKRAEETLRDREAKLAEAARLAKLGHWSRSLDDVTQEGSAVFYEIFGLDPASAVSLKEAFTQVVHPDDLAGLVKAIEESVAKVEPFDHVHRAVVRGEIRHIHAVGRVHIGPDGRPCRISGTAQDITDRLRMEADLQAKQEQYRRQSYLLQLILDNMGDGVVVANENGEFILFNPAAEQILNLGKTHGRPEAWSETYCLLLPDGETTFPPDQLPLIRAMRGESSEQVEMIVNHGRVPDPRWICVSGRPMRDENGQLKGGIVVFRNVSDGKKAENLLRTSEVRYRSLVAATAAIVWSSPASGDFDTPQPAWTAFTGQTLEQHRCWGWLQAIHPDDRDKSQQAWASALAECRMYQVEHRLRRSDGEYRHMQVRAVPILGAKGAVQEWVGVHTDVTEQKEAEKAAQLAQQRLQHVLASSPAVLYTLSIKDNKVDGISWISDNIRNLLGFTPEEVLAPSWWLANTHPDDRQPMIQITEDQLMRTGSSIHEYRIRHRDGQYRWIRGERRLIRDAAGVPLEVVGAWIDVTSRRLTEEALILRDRAIGATTQGIAISDPSLPDNPIIYVNPGFEKLTGYGQAEAVGRNCRFLQGKDTDRQALMRVAAAVKAAEPCNVELLNYRKDGIPFWIELSISPIRDTHGRLTHFVGVQTDVTARRKLEEQFRQAQKMEAFGQLAGGVAHDFNNLITVINGYSEYLIQSLPAGNPGRKMAAEILKAGERSAGLTRQLLAFSRQQILAPRVISVNEVVNEIDKMLRRLIGEDIRFTTTLASNLGSIRADPGQIEQVILNLAVNARDAMPKGGRLTIETQNVDLDENYTKLHADALAGPHVCLSVTDTGTGMPPEVQSRIFEPFFTTKGAGKGTGLGLATVFGIVKQSGGHVTVYSEVGVGTTFKVYVPRINNTPDPLETAPHRAPPPRGTETILLAEDESGVRTLAAHILSECGYKVLEANDGDEAVRVAASHNGPIDLLITDVVMPGVGGRSVAGLVAEKHPKILVLYMSGYTDDAVIRHGILREGVNFIQKPFSPVALAFKVRDALDAPVKTDGA